MLCARPSRSGTEPRPPNGLSLANPGEKGYQAFINNGIPTGGLFTGAEVPDPCYHEACDTFGNFSARALEVNADLIGFAVLTYAYSTAFVNGVPGVPVPGRFGGPLCVLRGENTVDEIAPTWSDGRAHSNGPLSN
jgi:hypothetical protein